MRGRSAFVLSFLVVASHACAQGTLEPTKTTQEDDEIGLSYEFVWGSENAFGSYLPIKVMVENPLKNDRGAVTLTRKAFKCTVPVELPSQTVRSFIVYIPTTDYDPAQLRLDCTQSHIQVDIEAYRGSGSDVSIGLISDVASSLTFLRAAVNKIDVTQFDGSEMSMRFADYSCLPESAPDRAIGYDGLDLLVLGEGTERVSDDVVRAIKGFVLGGGRVLFTGGAISPTLRDPRWQGIVPGVSPRVVTKPGSRFLSNILSARFSQEVSLTVIDPDDSASVEMDDGVPMFVTKGIGLGEVVYWAFDPFQGPVRNAANRSVLFERLFDGQKAARDLFLSTNNIVTTVNQDHYYPAFSRYGGYANEPTDASSAFSVEPPATGTVAFVLGLFFIVVIPINFIVLAKIKKGHWAWMTSPVIGVAFASIFFFISRELYSKSLSRATSAVVVSHEGAGIAYAFADQQFFFPRGGIYDLGLRGVEMFAPPLGWNEYAQWRQSSSSGFGDAVIDTGEMRVPAAAVSNLTFKETHVRQIMPFTYRFPAQIECVREGNSVRMKAVVTNDSPYVLEDVQLDVGLGSTKMDDIPPGRTSSVDTLLNIRDNDINANFGYSDSAGRTRFIPITREFGGVMLTARAVGLNVGSAIGNESGQAPRLVFTYDSMKGANQK